MCMSIMYVDIRYSFMCIEDRCMYNWNLLYIYLVTHPFNMSDFCR